MKNGQHITTYGRKTAAIWDQKWRKSLKKIILITPLPYFLYFPSFLGKEESTLLLFYG